MGKDKIVYVCRECGADYPKAYGKCPVCGAWNSFIEQHVYTEKPHHAGMHGYGDNRETCPIRVTDVNVQCESRFDTHNRELNRVLGGGLVMGSLVLIGGEPGIGKSTLVMQVALRMQGQRILYVSGEESVNQLKMRAERLGEMLSDCYLLSETSIEQIFTQIRNLKPEVLVIDSIQTVSMQTVESSPGSSAQVRECAAALLKFAKESGIPVLLIGHITKDGSIAGPKILEHIVDTVLQFEGDRHYMYRILRAHKNRFGSTDELAIFEMQQHGLREVSNPSELLLNHNTEGLSGVTVAAMVEGVRPFLIEVQALVSTAAYGIAQRSATGFDIRRMNMLLAVLERRAGFKIAQKDVFLNIAGGLRVNDPAVDLAVLVAVLSSNLDISVDCATCLTGEVGLSGEIRPISRIEQRITEAQKLGFKRILIPAFNFEQLPKTNRTIEVVGMSKIEDVFRLLFG